MLAAQQRQQAPGQVHAGNRQAGEPGEDRVQFQATAAADIQQGFKAVGQQPGQPKVMLPPGGHVGLVLLRPGVKKARHALQGLVPGLPDPLAHPCLVLIHPCASHVAFC